MNSRFSTNSTHGFIPKYLPGEHLNQNPPSGTHPPDHFIASSVQEKTSEHKMIRYTEGGGITETIRPRPLHLLPILFAIIAVLSIAAVPVSGYQMSNQSYQAVSAWYTDDLIAAYGNVPVYAPDGTVISTGIIEGLLDEKALWDWYYEINLIVNDTSPDMKAYYFPEGPVISYGHDILGTICIGIWEEVDTDRKTRDDIYTIIDAAARQRGIADVPVIFIREPIVDIKPLLWADSNDMPIMKPLYDIANGYPSLTTPAKKQNSYGMELTKQQPPSGIQPIRHVSISFLISFLSRQ